MMSAAKNAVVHRLTAQNAILLVVDVQGKLAQWAVNSDHMLNRLSKENSLFLFFLLFVLCRCAD